MWNPLRWWRERHPLTAPISEAQWRAEMARLPLLEGLSAAECDQLLSLARCVLQDKALEGVDGLELTPRIVASTALQLALPLLNLGEEWLEGWQEVVLYPAAFVVDHDETDAAGVVHRVHEARSGESWLRGPLILAWSDVAVGWRLDGHNVAIHEMAHKLDGLDGAINGHPPLHEGMSGVHWREVWGAAFAQLEAQEARGGQRVIDAYALTSPAECFAVFSEHFFELPHQLREHFPLVYGELLAFYRQDPAARLPHAGRDGHW